MKFIYFPILLFVFVFSNLFAQSSVWGDAEAAGRYAIWAQQALDEGRMQEALAGLERAADFANVSSDISYLLAYARASEGKNRLDVVQALDKALEINRWVTYNVNQALLLKAEQLIAMRRYLSALSCLDQIGERYISADPVFAADCAMARLLVFRGLAANTGLGETYNPVQATEHFRSLLVTAMDRFSRDPRPLKIFFEYMNSKYTELSGVHSADLSILELALRRLPFLLEADPELAWIAAAFMSNTEDARRLVASYRAGGIGNVQNRDFRPAAGSIPAALNLGLINDFEAVEELFSGIRGVNSPLPPGIAANGNPVIDKDIIVKVYDMFRGEEGRNLFMQKLLSFTGILISDDDNDGYFDSRTYYNSGVIREYEYDRNQENVFDLQITFSADGVPVSAKVPVTGFSAPAEVIWERYPSAGQITLAEERFSFRPADLQFAPVSFITIGGSTGHSGLVYPVPSNQLEISRRTLVSFCDSITRPSVEFDGAVEQIFFDRGFPRQAVEILNGQHVSVTEFERGAPVIQYIDLDLDGRMETIRRFHRPGQDYPWPDLDEKFDYRRLIASSESDWTGEGRFGTGEVYLQDGSVVYSWDIDGSGIMNYSETEPGN